MATTSEHATQPSAALEPADTATLSEKTAAAPDAEKAPAPAPPAFDFPDGGLEAWLVVAGGWLVLFTTFGYVNGTYYWFHLT
jgi:hypothetical protein